MDFIPPNFINYIFASIVINFVVIDFIKKELFLHIKEEVFIKYVFAYSLIIFSFLINISNFDIFILSLSLLINLPIAIVLYYLMSCCRITVAKKINTSNNKIFFVFKICFWLSLVSATACFSLLFFATSFDLPLFFNPFLLLIVPFILMIMFLFFVKSAKFIYHDNYVFIGIVRALDESIIKEKLGKNNIFFKIEQINNTDSDNRIVRVLVNEKQEYKAKFLLDSFVKRSLPF